MAKKTVTDENGHKYTVKEKKPFYKKWWFWVIVAIVVIAIGAGVGSGTSDKSSSDNSAKTEKKSSSDKSKDIKNTIFKIGQTASYKGVDVKANNVRYANSIGDETPDQGKQYVIVSVTMTNHSNNSIDYNDVDFKFNNNGDITDSESVSSDSNEMNTGELAKGATITKDVIGEVPSNVNQNALKMVFEPDFFNEDVKINFSLQQ